MRITDVQRKKILEPVHWASHGNTACCGNDKGINALQHPYEEALVGNPRPRSAIFAGTLLVLLLSVSGIALGQSLPDLYRITKGVSQYHVEYHQISLAKGAETVLAELAGPGKVTYLYITDDTH